MPILKGSYALIIRLERDTPLTIGRLGSFAFPAGLYLYAGSALNGLESRVRRHLRRDKDKKRHWHIDYLTAVAPVCQVWWAADGQRRECEWAGIARDWGGKIVVPGFGASDCRRCPAHLLYLEMDRIDGMDPAALAKLRAALLDELPPETPRGVFQPAAAGDSVAGLMLPSFPRKRESGAADNESGFSPTVIPA